VQDVAFKDTAFVETAAAKKLQGTETYTVKHGLWLLRNSLHSDGADPQEVVLTTKTEGGVLI
jgi:hypothetical protein